MTAQPNQHQPAGAEVRKGLLFGLLSGITAITCCVSPVVLVLIGVVTAAEAVTLGDTLYYTYGWFFRAAGFIVAAVAVYLFLRGRRSCSIAGARELLEDARRARPLRRRSLRRPLLVHQVLGHLVRLTPAPLPHASLTKHEHTCYSLRRSNNVPLALSLSKGLSGTAVSGRRGGVQTRLGPRQLEGRRGVSHTVASVAHSVTNVSSSCNSL